MEVELKNLIDKIKTEGVEQATAEAQTLTAEANQKAEKIIEEAKAKADNIETEARAAADAHSKNTDKALKQASRDTLLALRERVVEFFERVVRDKVREELSPKILTDIIAKAVEHCVKEKAMDVEILVNDKDRDALEKSLLGTLKVYAKERVVVKGAKNIEKGFRIGEQDKDFYLDFTDEAIVESFKRYLNPKLIDTLDIDLGIAENKKDGK